MEFGMVYSFEYNVSVTYNGFHNKSHQDKKDINGWTYMVFLLHQQTNCQMVSLKFFGKPLNLNTKPPKAHHPFNIEMKIHGLILGVHSKLIKLLPILQENLN
ncbi:hypothetical protein VP01_13954g1, partial [Puccinia sorghi]